MTQLISMQPAVWKTTQKFDVRRLGHSEANLLFIYLIVTMTSSLLSIFIILHRIYVEKGKKNARTVPTSVSALSITQHATYYLIVW